MQNNPISFPMQNAGGLIPNPFNQVTPNQPVINTLNLNQVKGIVPVKDFVDEMNVQWTLYKAATNSAVDIPSPKTVQVTDCWVHQYLGTDAKVYVYVVEGIRMPRVPTEQPSRILYQWYSEVYVQNFNHTMITDAEWLKANVYTAPGTNARMSKLTVFCPQPNNNGQQQSPVDNKPIFIEGISNNGSGQHTETNS